MELEIAKRIHVNKSKKGMYVFIIAFQEAGMRGRYSIMDEVFGLRRPTKNLTNLQRILLRYLIVCFRSFKEISISTQTFLSKIFLIKIVI